MEKAEQTSGNPDARVNEFVAMTIKGLRVQLSRHGVEPGLQDDVVSLAMVRLTPRLARTMAKYPSGDVYARSVWRTMLIDTLRSEGAQRGAGFRRQRVVLSTSSEEIERLCKSDSDEIVDRLTFHSLLRRLTPEERHDAWRICIDGYSLSEVARMNREAHTTVGRRLRRSAHRVTTACSG